MKSNEGFLRCIEVQRVRMIQLRETKKKKKYPPSDTLHRCIPPPPSNVWLHFTPEFSSARTYELPMNMVVLGQFSYIMNPILCRMAVNFLNFWLIWLTFGCTIMDWSCFLCFIFLNLNSFLGRCDRSTGPIRKMKKQHQKLLLEVQAFFLPRTKKMRKLFYDKIAYMK